MSGYDLGAVRCRLRAFFNQRNRCAATLYAGRHATVRLDLGLFYRIYLSYADRARKTRICYHDTYGAGSVDWSLDADAPGQPALPGSEPPVVTAWVELRDGDIRLEVVFTPEEVRCLKVFVDQPGSETQLKEVVLPYDGPMIPDGIEPFLGDSGWPAPPTAVAPRAVSGAVPRVLAGAGQWAVEQADCLDFLASLPEGALRLVIGSPPYPEKGERYRGGRRRWDTDDWVAWMLRVTEQAVRVCSGDVLWVANGAVRGGRYLPACEGLIWEWHRRGGVCERPCIWHKNAPPSRRDWFGNDWEFVLAFRQPGNTRTFNWHTGGGGHLRSELAHENEAPYPEKPVKPFVRALTGPGDIVCDPFSGSGTTGAVALRHGRRFLGCDSRQSEGELSRRRLQAEDDKML